MQAIKENLMREICRPELLAEIKIRFKDKSFPPFDFRDTIIEAAKDGVRSFVPGNGYPSISYRAIETSPFFFGTSRICEFITFNPSEWKSEGIAQRCYDAPFDARLYQETCKSYQTNEQIQLAGGIAGLGAALKAYQNFKAGNHGYGLGWVAIGVASVALSRIYSS